MDNEIQVDVMLRDSKSMRATVEVSLETAQGTVTIGGFKVIEQNAGKPWVSLPSKEYVGKDGQKKYQKLVEMSKPLSRAVMDKVLKSYEEKLGRKAA